ncbi:LysE family transporter [Sorangium sp. So ce281]|uniref:LysE family transporter n=1 Tax=unclassified Sorangium TaxID=2621164 RepID=UPI003F5DA582
MALALVVGFLLGYLGSIPAAGPLAVLLVAAALAGQPRRVLLLAIGGAFAEGLWALAAARGLGWVLEAHPAIDRALRTGGAALVVAMGLALALAPRRAAEAPSSGRATSALLTGFVLVALNPSFLASWIASCAVLRAYPALAPAVAPAHAAVRRRWDRIDWTRPIPPGALVIPEAHYMDVAGLGLTERQRVAINRLFTCFTCELFIHFEGYVIRYLERSAHRAPYLSAPVVARFVAEERTHAEMFRRLLHRLRPDLYPTDGDQTTLLPRPGAFPYADTVADWLIAKKRARPDVTVVVLLDSNTPANPALTRRRGALVRRRLADAGVLVLNACLFGARFDRRRRLLPRMNFHLDHARVRVPIEDWVERQNRWQVGGGLICPGVIHMKAVRREEH